MGTWLAVKDVAELLDVTERTVQRKISKKELVAKRKGKGYLIDLSSLPPEAQLEYAKRFPEAEVVFKERRSRNGREYSLAEIMDLYGQEAVQEALEKVRVAKEALEVKYDLERTEKLERLAQQNGISLTTLYRWMEAYEEDSLMGLIKKPPKSRGKRHSLPEEAIKFIKGLYLQPIKPQGQWVYDRYKERAREKGWPVASRATVYRVLQELSESELVMGREGLEEWRKKIMPKATRDITVLKTYEILVGDHHTFDLFVAHGGRAVRPDLTAWMDARSRAIVGWCISLQGNSETISLALRHAMLPKEDPEVPFCGIPVLVYIDNGKDYRSKRLTGGMKTARKDYSLEAQGVLANLKVEATYCEPYSPWAKEIERWFETLTNQFTRYLPGFCGTKPEDRPPGFDEKKLLERGELLTLPELVVLFEQYLKKYHTTYHATLKDIPLNVYLSVEKAREGVPQPEALDLLMMKYDNAVVQTDGIHRFNHVYWHDDLINLINHKVTIRFDPNRIGELWVYYQGEKVCVAENKELLSMHASEEDIKKWRRVQARARKEVLARINSYGVSQDDLREIVASTFEDGPAIFTGRSSSKPAAVTTLTGFEKEAREAKKRRRKEEIGEMGHNFFREKGLKLLGGGNQR